MGLLLSVVVNPADVQDRDGAFQLLRRARRLFPFIERIFADGGYAGKKMALVVWRTGAWRLRIVKRSDVVGCEVLSKRWIVETDVLRGSAVLKRPVTDLHFSHGRRHSDM